ncbi:MAG: hypothetical protein ABJB74_12920 [Gemmatimonas sp.]
MLSCKEITRLCASEDIRQATFARRVEVRLHLLMCRHCRRYVRELSAIGVAARRAFAKRSTHTDTPSPLEQRLIADIRRMDSRDKRS